MLNLMMNFHSVSRTSMKIENVAAYIRAGVEGLDGREDGDGFSIAYILF